jgi:hypothetical protein
VKVTFEVCERVVRLGMSRRGLRVHMELQLQRTRISLKLSLFQDRERRIVPIAQLYFDREINLAATTELD